MHDVVVVGVPLIAILAGILFSRADVKSLRDEVRGDIKDLRNEMRDEFRAVRSEMRTLHSDTREQIRAVQSQLDRVDADLRQFYHLTGTLEARMDSIEKR